MPTKYAHNNQTSTSRTCGNRMMANGEIDEQYISYTDFNKVQSIVDLRTNSSAEFSYGPTQERHTMSVETGNYMFIRSYTLNHEFTNVRNTHTGSRTHYQKDYIYSPYGLVAAYIIETPLNVLNARSTQVLIPLATDHLGSIVAEYDPAERTYNYFGYDAWGRRYVDGDHHYLDETELSPYADEKELLSYFSRGYTGHEHLDLFGLINMNGRLYDPVLGRMLSPDPFVPDGTYSQDFNRYTYARNNPLSYVDPDGEFVFSLFLPVVGVFLDAACWGAVIGGAGYTASVAFSDGGFSNWDNGAFWKSVGIGAISGAVTAGIGSIYGSVGSMGVSGEIARAYVHGVANGAISELSGGDFMQGFASGALSSVAGSAFMMYGGNFASSTLGTYAFSAAAGGTGAAMTGGNFWEGAAIGVMNAGLNHLAQGIQQRFTDAQLKKIHEAYRSDVIDYPTAESFYEYIGGPLGEWAANSPELFGNTCAARLSKALNYSNFEIPAGTSGAYLGGDGKYYFINAQKMADYLSKNKVWGAPTLLKNNQRVKNAVIFQTGFGGGVTGHLDVIYRGQPANHIYNTKTYWWH